MGDGYSDSDVCSRCGELKRECSCESKREQKRRAVINAVIKLESARQQLAEAQVSIQGYKDAIVTATAELNLLLGI